MSTSRPTASPATHGLRLLALVAAVSIASVLTGFAFAGWLDHGAEIFMSYAEAGLAWCF